MNILYGIQTTGNGHLARSHAVISELRKRGHHVNILLSGENKQNNWIVNELAPNAIFKGARIVVNNGKLQHIATLKQIYLPTLWRDIKNLDVQPYDVIISDFEPITAWAGKLNKKFTIGIANQYAFANKKFTPLKYKFSSHQLVMNYLAPVNLPIGFHWQPVAGSILPPIGSTISPVKNINKQLIVVYLPWENLNLIKPILRQLPEYIFHIYDPHCDVANTADNIFHFPFSKENFHTDLQQCHGIMCNAGFTLITEALTLGKRLLVKPMNGIEQIVNTNTIRKFNFGMTTKKIVLADLKNWLTSDFQPPILQVPNVAKLIVNWLEQRNWSSTQTLVQEAWKNTKISR